MGIYQLASIWNLESKEQEFWNENMNILSRPLKDRYPECVYNAEGWGYQLEIS